MSLLENLLGGLFGESGNGENIQKPCGNCASDCPVCPAACAECKPYKDKLADLLYDADHLEAYYDRYEVVPTGGADIGNTTCPYCFAPTPANATACEYCGSQLREGSGKIRVMSAKEIPNPILEAQDAIFDRHEIVRKYQSDDDSGAGILETLADLVTGGQEKDTFGDRMTEDEIKTTAAVYGVSVGTYLQGLDTGKYLTASAKAESEKAGAYSAAIPAAGLGLGGAALGGILGSNSRQSDPFGIARQRQPKRPPMPGRRGSEHSAAGGAVFKPAGKTVTHGATRKAEPAARAGRQKDLIGMAKPGDGPFGGRPGMAKPGDDPFGGRPGAAKPGNSPFGGNRGNMPGPGENMHGAGRPGQTRPGENKLPASKSGAGRNAENKKKPGGRGK